MVSQKRIAWIMNRLRTMAPAEVLSRVVDVGRHLSLYGSLKRVERQSRRIRIGNKYIGFQSIEVDGQVYKDASEIQKTVVGKADAWREHRASLFGLGNAQLGDAIEWHRDYSSGFVCDKKYSPLINSRDISKAGNVKYIWELNRLQHLVLLASAWLLTGNRIYGEEIEKQIRSWRTNNPFMKGVNWKSPLEASLRLISWAYVSFLSTGVNEAKESYHKSLQETIYLHQYFIRKFHSKHSSANNHLIGEMAGLYVASVLWPCFKESTSWRAFARGKLIQEMARQVEDDGVGKERATEYQLFILEFFLLAGTLGQVMDEPFPLEFWERLNGMATFLAVISDRSGNVPMFGDGDSGQVVWLPETTAERARALVRIGERRENGTVDSDLRSTLLLWGQKKEKVPLAPIQRPTEGLQVFPHGGYYVLAADRGRENEMLVVFDAGPLGLPPLYAHGHADALSFWLSYGGCEFLIDPGTYCYYTHERWRSYFRGTTAHNTVRVDGQDQSVPGEGPFLWRHVAECRAERVEENAEFIEVEGFHDGYRRFTDPVIHHRRIRLSKRSKVVKITDRVECHGTHDIELFFHFSEKCDVTQVGPHTFNISNSDKHLTLRILDSQLHAELYRGSETPICGWVSPTFDVKEPSFTLVARSRITESTQFLSEIAPR